LLAGGDDLFEPDEEASQVFSAGSGETMIDGVWLEQASQKWHRGRRAGQCVGLFFFCRRPVASIFPAVDAAQGLRGSLGHLAVHPPRDDLGKVAVAVDAVVAVDARPQAGGARSS